MERARWPDERLDDRMTAIDRTFDHLWEEARADRAELRAELRAEMRAMRVEIKSETAAIRSDISALQRQMTQIFARFTVALLGIVAAGVGAALAATL
jgi:hypothetical protein